jgi:hypothetical protein
MLFSKWEMAQYLHKTMFLSHLQKHHPTAVASPWPGENDTASPQESARRHQHSFAPRFFMGKIPKLR